MVGTIGGLLDQVDHELRRLRVLAAAFREEATRGDYDALLRVAHGARRYLRSTLNVAEDFEEYVDA